jgi:hypothetical protein
MGRNAIVGAVLVLLVLVVVGASVGNLAGKSSSSSAVNSPSTPLSGEQLFAAFSSNETLADATYATKNVYVQDVIDPGEVGSMNDPNMGQYFSTIDFGTVVLYWSHQSQALQVLPGEKVLAQCNVKGMEMSMSGDYLLYLMNCQFATAS